MRNLTFLLVIAALLAVTSTSEVWADPDLEITGPSKGTLALPKPGVFELAGTSEKNDNFKVRVLLDGEEYDTANIIDGRWRLEVEVTKPVDLTTQLIGPDGNVRNVSDTLRITIAGVAPSPTITTIPPATAAPTPTPSPTPSPLPKATTKPAPQRVRLVVMRADFDPATGRADIVLEAKGASTVLLSSPFMGPRREAVRKDGRVRFSKLDLNPNGIRPTPDTYRFTATAYSAARKVVGDQLTIAIEVTAPPAPSQQSRWERIRWWANYEGEGRLALYAALTSIALLVLGLWATRGRKTPTPVIRPVPGTSLAWTPVLVGVLAVFYVADALRAVIHEGITLVETAGWLVGRLLRSLRAAWPVGRQKAPSVPPTETTDEAVEPAPHDELPPPPAEMTTSAAEKLPDEPVESLDGPLLHDINVEEEVPEASPAPAVPVETIPDEPARPELVVSSAKQVGLGKVELRGQTKPPRPDLVLHITLLRAGEGGKDVGLPPFPLFGGSWVARGDGIRPGTHRFVAGLYPKGVEKAAPLASARGDIEVRDDFVEPVTAAPPAKAGLTVENALHEEGDVLIVCGRAPKGTKSVEVVADTTHVDAARARGRTSYVAEDSTFRVRLTEVPNREVTLTVTALGERLEPLDLIKVRSVPYKSAPPIEVEHDNLLPPPGAEEKKSPPDGGRKGRKRR